MTGPTPPATDTGEWDYESASVQAPPKNPAAVYSVRFLPSEMREIRAAARAQGITASELIRGAALRAVRPEPGRLYFGTDGHNIQSPGRTSLANGGSHSVGPSAPGAFGGATTSRA